MTTFSGCKKPLISRYTSVAVTETETAQELRKKRRECKSNVTEDNGGTDGSKGRRREKVQEEQLVKTRI